MPHNHPNLPEYFAVCPPHYDSNEGKEIVRWFKDHGYSPSYYEGSDGPTSYYGIVKGTDLIKAHSNQIFKDEHPETVLFTYKEWKEKLNEKWVECINDYDIFVGTITKGNIYKVLKEDGKHYTIIDDLGKEHGFFLSRFKIVSAPSVQKKKIIGYKKIKDYPLYVDEGDIPGKIGDIFPSDKFSKLYSKWPEFWEPQYEPEKPKEIILTLGNPKPREIRITKDKIEAKTCYGHWRNIPVANVESLMRLLDLSHEFKGKIKTFEVDGTIFTMEDIFKVWEAKLSFND